MFSRQLCDKIAHHQLLQLDGRASIGVLSCKPPSAAHCASNGTSFAYSFQVRFASDKRHFVTWRWI
jgi:hypothetical protein